MKRISKISLDLVFSIFSSFIPLFLLQFVIQPFIARKIGAEDYGGLLLIVGVFNIGMGIFGNSLNNTRLVDNQLYKEEKGDYSLLLFIFSLLNIVFIFTLLKINQISIDFIACCLIIGISLFSVSVTYLSTEYRINLNYVKIFIGKVFLGFGYLIGMLVFQNTSRWEWVFFCGYGFELVFTLLTTSLWKESFRKTQHFKNTIRRLFFLVISTLIGSILIYLDRLIIYPFFGGTELSIYYAASIVGKTVIMFAGPIAGVLLSYLSQMTSIKLKDFVSFTFVLSILAVVGYFLCLWISHPLIEILYPELLPYSMEYVPYTIVSAMFEMMYIFIWPIVLRFGKSYYPLVITTVKALFYLVIGIILIRVMGVMGVVVASIIASVTQFLVVLVLGFQVSKKKYQIDSNMCHEMK